MNPESTEQDNQVAKNYIQPSEIQEGDLIKVKFNYKNGTVQTRKGVATDQLGVGKWRDSVGFYLTGTSNAETITIELIDRPKPRTSVPTKPGAVVSYKRASAYGADERSAVRDSGGKWSIYSNDGTYRDTRHSDKAFEDMFHSAYFAATDLKVIFPGVGA